MIGRRLKQERKKRGWTLDEVSRHLRIHVDYLKAIEEEEWERLPPGYYRKAFLKSYQQFLGIFPGEMKDSDSGESGTNRIAGSLNIPRSIRYIFIFAVIVGTLVFAGWLEHRRMDEKSDALITSQTKNSKVENTTEGLMIIVSEPGRWNIKARKDVEVEILSDDELLYRGKIRMGERFEVTAQKKLEIRARNVTQTLEIAHIRDSSIKPAE